MSRLVAAIVSLSISAAPAPRALFHLADPRLAEVSGVAVGIASPDVVYVHNDSGDSARFFALDARTGTVLATYSIPGATNVDWEDIAVARDARGVPSVWIGDIGDNDARRSEVRIYRVDEPHVDRTGRDVAATTGAADVWRLRYPSGPADAESLAVAPGGAAYVVTKSVLGMSSVYAVPVPPDASRVRPMRHIGEVTFPVTDTAGPFGPAGSLAATGADISRDGRRLVIRTYADAYIWRMRSGDVAAALRGTALHVALPEQPQGEGVAFDGGRLLIDSEHVGSAVYRMPIPAAAASSPVQSPSPTESVPVNPKTPGHSTSVWVILAIIAGVALVALTPFIDWRILRRLGWRRRGRRM